MTAEVDTDVAIVGCGPVGATLAVLLGQRGHDVVVLERWPAPYPRPRAVHFDHEVGRIFQACGIGDRLRALTEPAPVYEWRDGAGTTLLRFGRIGESSSGWPESSMFHQPALEALLDDRLDLLPAVTVRRGTEVTSIDQDDEAVTLGTAGGPVATARWVVGCDGAHSTVRAAAGLAVVDLGFSSDWLIVDVILDEERTFDPVNVQICDPARPTTAVSGGPGRRRWEFMRLPGESVDDLDDPRRAWELLAPWDVHPGNARLERHAVYTFEARWADTWRAGRVLLAGDAAHLMPPFAGQGMGAGIRDAANLAWKLDSVLTGVADPILLDTYGTERIPDARTTIEFSVELGRVICVADPAEAAARDQAMAPAVGAGVAEAPDPPPVPAGFLHPDAPWRGHLFVQGRVGGRLSDDVHGAGWRLVTVGAPVLDVGLEEWFTSIGGEVVALADPDPTYRHWFDQHDCTAALQRPDFRLYGTAVDGRGAAGLLADLRRGLTAGVAAG